MAQDRQPTLIAQSFQKGGHFFDLCCEASQVKPLIFQLW